MIACSNAMSVLPFSQVTQTRLAAVKLPDPFITVTFRF